MKGIYLTEEGKQEIENKITELEKHEFQNPPVPADGIVLGSIYQLRQILSSATIVPVEDSWEITKRNQLFDLPHYLRRKYPNGLIIQPK